MHNDTDEDEILRSREILELPKFNEQLFNAYAFTKRRVNLLDGGLSQTVFG